MDLTLVKNQIVDYLKSYDPLKIAIFGSYARGEQSENSDLDILIGLKTPVSLLDLVKMERELSELLNLKVDLVTESSLKNPRLRAYVESSLEVIYQ